MEQAMFAVLGPQSKKEKTCYMKKASIKIGRSSTNDIYVDDPRCPCLFFACILIPLSIIHDLEKKRMSREHASIDSVGGRLVLSDLGSKRGSKLNRKRINERMVLRAGDVIKVGKTHITVLRK